MIALDVAPDHSTATIAAPWRTEGGTPSLRRAHEPSVDWVAERAAGITTRWGGRLLVEQTGVAAFLLPALERAGADVDPVNRRTYADACGTLEAAVTARTARHGKQPELNAAVAVARWSTHGDNGQRVLSRRDARVSPPGRRRPRIAGARGRHLPGRLDGKPLNADADSRRGCRRDPLSP